MEQPPNLHQQTWLRKWQQKAKDALVPGVQPSFWIHGSIQPLCSINVVNAFAMPEGEDLFEHDLSKVGLMAQFKSPPRISLRVSKLGSEDRSL